MKLGVVVSAPVIAVFVTVIGAAVFSTPASADVTPGCTATLNGQSANTIDTPGTALEVAIDSDVVAAVTGPSEVVYHSVGLEFAAIINWTVSEGDDDGTDNSFSDTVQ